MRGALSAEAHLKEVDLVRETLNKESAPHWQEFLAAWKA
jgi:hypothetical protein